MPVMSLCRGISVSFPRSHTALTPGAFFDATLVKCNTLQSREENSEDVPLKFRSQENLKFNVIERWFLKITRD